MTRKRALIATIPPARGGIPALLRVTLGLLAERGIEAVVAWYEPWSLSPRLSVPLLRIGTRKPDAERRAVEGAAEGWAIGAWLPELEFTHYQATTPWRQLIGRADLHLVVSGTALAGRAFVETGAPFLAWLASDWSGDRRERAASFPWPRRALDAFVVRPIARRLERRILRAGSILALSEATRRALDLAAGQEVVRARLPAPIDPTRFRPEPEAVVPGRIGLVGRFDDPRKNVGLFLAALARARALGFPLTGELIGAQPSAALTKEIFRLGLADAVEIAGELEPTAYASRLRRLDLLAITSHQEGLHIAALEAMASGCPVVSTRCGGPEEYVRDGETGFLAEATPDALAARFASVSCDRSLRNRLADAARKTVGVSYSPSLVHEIFGRALEELQRSMSRSSGP